MHRRTALLLASLFVVSVASWGLARATTPVLPRAYTALIRADGGPSVTATSARPTVTPQSTRTPIATPDPTTLLTNGDFEQGATYWLPQQSADAYITDTLTVPIVAHSGTHVLRLAPDADGFASAIDAVNVVVPVNTPYLSYWVWIRSTEASCISDVGGAGVDSGHTDPIFLCTANQANGWARRSLNLSDFAGQPVTIEISAGSYTAGLPGGTHNSVLYVDDVGWRATP